MLFALAGQDHIGSYIVKDICIHNPETRNSWEGVTQEACYCMAVVLQQYGLYWVNISNVNILVLNSCDENEGDWHLKYVLDIRSFVCNEVCEDSTLVLKCIVVGI
jgi:hypothetical protein